MKEIEATRLKLKCLEMVEGTRLKWWEVAKFCGKVTTAPLMFSSPESSYEIALGIVEGKPVWKGDRLYSTLSKEMFAAEINLGTNSPYYSWNPPKPKTVVVELPLDYVKNQAALSKHQRIWPTILSKACAEALETLE